LIARFTKIVTLSVFMAVALLPQQGHAAGKKEPTVIKDPHYGEVLFYFYQGEYFPAIVRLLAAQQQSHLENHLEESELLLGGLYLSYGHHLYAAEIFERLLADNVEPEIRDRTWFFLAKIWHQRGYLTESQDALNNIQGEMPKALESERHMLQAQILIDEGEYDRAIALLQSWQGKTAWASYAKFNLGVAMVRSGRVDAAAKILDDLGNLDPYNEELSSLRDKANLALGYAYLQDGQPIAAKPPLQRVRLEGPFSNKALLGVGWADAEKNNYRRALVPWMELRSRDLLDSAVQESMLAIPYAMAKLDSISQAADHYLNAVEAFYEETNRINRTIAHIESGDMFDEFLEQDPLETTGWYWTLDELPEGPESRYLLHLLATHSFQEGLKNYRDLGYLRRNLEDWQKNIGVYRNMLDTRELAYRKRLPRIEDSLHRADLDGMVNRKLEFDARLNGIEQSGDSLALATEREYALWGEITALERTPALAADIPEAEEVRDKIRLLKGVLQWNLDKEFKSRLWKIRRDVKQTGQALVETQRARRAVDETMRGEPRTFESFNARVNGLKPRIDALHMQVDAAMGRQRAFLQSIAVEELRAQQQRLSTYSVQARFALAAIYDLSATVGDASQ
jgi:outer membrane protein assembly factor BamD (BamD/ComL family)